MELVLGTRNSGKISELKELCRPLGIQVCSLEHLSKAIHVEEIGASFLENATLKAVLQAKALGRFVLAEDSGLVVDSLNGEPGIYSARWSGEHASESENNRTLLSRMKEFPHERCAHYECHAVLSDPSGNVVAHSSGSCHGDIATSLRGIAGFGYDPLFIIREYHSTFGELSDMVKSVISHRARAMRALLPVLENLTHVSFKQ